MNNSLTSLDMIYVFIAFVISIISVVLVKKIIYRFKLKKRYYIFPRVRIKGITSIAMVIALSTAILVLMTLFTSNILAIIFRAFPGTRVTFEGILIKIGGLIFGPFIGMFVGAITDLLTIAFTAGIFHYGYFIGSLTYGLIGGLIRTIVVFSNKKDIKFAIYSVLSLTLVGICLSLYFWYYVGDSLEPVNFLSLTINLDQISLIAIVISMCLFGNIMIIAFFFLSRSSKIKSPWVHNQFMTFCPVLLVVVVSEILINIFMLPTFDADISTMSVSQWLIIRVVISAPLIVFNLAVIWPIYKIVFPLVGYDYRKDLSENLNIPYIYKGSIENESK